MPKKMKHSLFLIFSLITVTLILTSCSEKIEKISKSPDGSIIVYEGRNYGAVSAPDSVKAYLVSSVSDSTSLENVEAVFEGQDVGLVCYSWPTSKELNISISGGYVDHVASQWQSSDGRRVTIRYTGTSGCMWHRTK